MKPAFMRPKLAICYYGNKILPTIDASAVLNKVYDAYDITYFTSFEDPILYRNLMLVSNTKRCHEIQHGEFDVCMTFNLSCAVTGSILSDSANLFNISDINHGHKLYFGSGGFIHNTNSNSINPGAFCASSLIFDLACNFHSAMYLLPADRQGKTINEDFYFFLKTLKIKTECTNYENSNLFKRST